MVATINKSFSLGMLVATPGALDALQTAGQTPSEFISRHRDGDWGEVCAEDSRENDLSVEQGYRILSVYRTNRDVRIWIITESDRSATTVLLPEEY